jgi:hypothetical protein
MYACHSPASALAWLLVLLLAAVFVVIVAAVLVANVAAVLVVIVAAVFFVTVAAVFVAPDVVEPDELPPALDGPVEPERPPQAARVRSMTKGGRRRKWLITPRLAAKMPAASG